MIRSEFFLRQYRFDSFEEAIKVMLKLSKTALCTGADLELINEWCIIYFNNKKYNFTDIVFEAEKMDIEF